MKVCIIGNGLTSFSLAKTLVNLDINVDIYFEQKKKIYENIQTLGISKTNTDFFSKSIINIDKLLWKINEIEVFRENLNNEKILNFKNKNSVLFSTIKNSELYNSLFKDLNKHKLISFKKKFDLKNIKKNKYKLIFNCENNNLITRKFFYIKNIKNYNSKAYITIIRHKKINNNFTASQIFTKIGPIAFLPLSPTETSVVYSIKGEKKINLESLIKKHNIKYEIIEIYKYGSFNLKSLNLRTYRYENILAFGDLLHKLHPLAGQGFNMTIRDIKEIYKLIKFRIDNGLDLDNSILIDFENTTKHKNYIFLNGIDFIYEIFNFENKFDNPLLSKSIQFIGKNKNANKLFTNFADVGIII